MKKSFPVSIIILLLSNVVYCQVKTTINTNDPVFSFSDISEDVTELPPMDVVELLREDSINNEETLTVNRFGKAYEDSFGMTAGVYKNTSQGSVWSMVIHGEKAKSLNVVFNNVVLSKDAKLYVTNKDQSFVFGPVSSCDIPQSGRILSDIIPDSVISIILFEPNGQVGESSFEISKVVYGYRTSLFVDTRQVGGDGVDICLMPEYEFYSDAIGNLLLADGEHWCTGALVMTTDRSFRPYFLTSYRAVTRQRAMVDCIDDIENGMYKFHTRIKNAGTNTITTSYCYYGAAIKSYFSFQDFILVELHDELKNNSVHTWLGWDRSGNTPNNNTSLLYHSSNGLEKVKVFDLPVSTKSFNDLFSYWTIRTNLPYNYDGYYSFGAPLLNDNNRLVGHLYQVYCDFTSGFVFDLLFNKFSEAFNWSNDSTMTLYHWLDPINTGQLTMDADKPLSISGPTIPYNYQIYEIQNLPNDWSVNWTLEENDLLLDTIGLAFNECAIDNSNIEHINDTLKAEILKNGITIKTLKKHINTGVNYTGHVAGLRLDSPIYNLELIDGATYVPTGDLLITVYSYYLPGSKIYMGNVYKGLCLGSSYSWVSNYPNYGISVPFKAIKENTYEHFEIVISSLFSYQLNIEGTANNTYSISLLEISNNSEAPVCRSVDNWNLSIYNSATKDLKHQEIVSGTSAFVNVETWDAGMYIVRAEKDGNILTKKIIK